MPLATWKMLPAFRGSADRLLVPGQMRPESAVRYCGKLGRASNSGDHCRRAAQASPAAAFRRAAGWCRSRSSIAWRFTPAVPSRAPACSALERCRPPAARNPANSIRPTPPRTPAASAAPSPPMPAGRAASASAAHAAMCPGCAWRLIDGRLLDSVARRQASISRRHIPLPAVTKNTAGYLLRPGMDWIDLFVGCEGTLGVVTEADWELLPTPAAVLAGVVFLRRRRRRSGRRGPVALHRAPRMLEYFDRASLDLLRARFPEIPAAARPPCCSIGAGDIGRPIAGPHPRAPKRSLVRRLRSGSRALPPFPPCAAGTGERHRPPRADSQDEFRLRRPAGRATARCWRIIAAG